MDLTFKVGDHVILVKRGDKDGCPGGPGIGARGEIAKIDTTASCGPYRVVWGGYGGWWTDAAHLNLDDDPNALHNRVPR